MDRQLPSVHYRPSEVRRPSELSIETCQGSSQWSATRCQKVSPKAAGLGLTFSWQLPRRVHANKSPLKIWEKMERGRIQGLPKFPVCGPIIVVHSLNDVPWWPPTPECQNKVKGGVARVT